MVQVCLLPRGVEQGPRGRGNGARKALRLGLQACLPPPGPGHRGRGWVRCGWSGKAEGPVAATLQALPSLFPPLPRSGLPCCVQGTSLCLGFSSVKWVVAVHSLRSLRAPKELTCEVPHLRLPHALSWWGATACSPQVPDMRDSPLHAPGSS